MTGLAQMLSGVWAVDPAADAIEFKHRWHTWGELAGIHAAIDALLQQAGLGAGARVGALLRNSPGMYATVQSLCVAGRCMVTVNPLLPEDKLCADLRSLQVPALIAESADWERPGLADTAHAIGAMAIALTGDPAVPARTLPGLERPACGLDRAYAPGIVFEMLTSGTTGTPKRVPLQASRFEKSMLDTLMYERDRKPDDPPRLRPGVQILAQPFVHIGGLWGLFTVALAGRQACLLEKFNVDEWLDAVRRHRPKVSGGPPAALRMILDANVPREDLSSLVALRTGAAPLDPAVEDAFYERYGIAVLQNYAATEFGTVGGWTLADYRAHRLDKRGSVGRIQQGIEARIVDPADGHELPPGEEGLLELRAPHIGDGRSWLRTTDRAALDADRFLWIRGRADNAIIRGGFKVHPDDVVKALEQHPAIREAGVAGVPDPRLGQVPVAALVIEPGQSWPGEEAIGAFLRERLLPYQLPVRYKVVAELPRTPSYKVSLPGVRELFAADAGAQ
ncbi:MAG: class I adenylate-forming enzyme family protein [Gammaproteobacteria bacterium]